MDSEEFFDSDNLPKMPPLFNFHTNTFYYHDLCDPNFHTRQIQHTSWAKCRKASPALRKYLNEFKFPDRRKYNNPSTSAITQASESDYSTDSESEIERKIVKRDPNIAIPPPENPTKLEVAFESSELQSHKYMQQFPSIKHTDHDIWSTTNDTKAYYTVLSEDESKIIHLQWIPCTEITSYMSVNKSAGLKNMKAYFQNRTICSDCQIFKQQQKNIKTRKFNLLDDSMTSFCRFLGQRWLYVETTGYKCCVTHHMKGPEETELYELKRYLPDPQKENLMDKEAAEYLAHFVYDLMVTYEHEEILPAQPKIWRKQFDNRELCDVCSTSLCNLLY